MLDERFSADRERLRPTLFALEVLAQCILNPVSMCYTGEESHASTAASNGTPDTAGVGQTQYEARALGVLREEVIAPAAPANVGKASSEFVLIVPEQNAQSAAVESDSGIVGE